MHHVAHFLVYNVLAKFQLICIIACRDILYFVFWLPYRHTLWRHQYLICIIQKSWISLERDEIWQKGKHHSSSLLNAFQIRLFFNTSIFHFIGTLRPFVHRYFTANINLVSKKSSSIMAKLNIQSVSMDWTYNTNSQTLFTWLWRWLPPRLSKQKSPIKGLFRTTWTITLNEQLMPWVQTIYRVIAHFTI